jgi:hypothetical protein
MSDAQLDWVARRRAIRNKVVPALDRIGSEFFKQSESLRLALNDVLRAGPDEWPDVLFKAGPLFLREPDGTVIPEDSYRYNPRGARPIAKLLLVKMVVAAAGQNRVEFDKHRGELRDDEPESNAVAQEVFRQDVAPLLLGNPRRQQCPQLVRSITDELAKFGIRSGPGTATTEEIRETVNPLPPMADCVLAVWADECCEMVYRGSDGMFADPKEKDPAGDLPTRAPSIPNQSSESPKLTAEADRSGPVSLTQRHLESAQTVVDPVGPLSRTQWIPILAVGADKTTRKYLEKLQRDGLADRVGDGQKAGWRIARSKLTSNQIKQAEAVIAKTTAGVMKTVQRNRDIRSAKQKTKRASGCLPEAG